MKKISRRSFLAVCGAMAATAALTACGGSSASTAGTAASGSTAGSTAGSAGVTALGTIAVKTGADFDSAMSKVAAVSGATGSEMDALREKAREMGSKTKFSASEAADAMNYKIGRAHV